MNPLHILLFFSFAAMAMATIIASSRDYLPPTSDRIFFHQNYYPSRPIYNTGGYYRPGGAYSYYNGGYNGGGYNGGGYNGGGYNGGGYSGGGYSGGGYSGGGYSGGGYSGGGIIGGIGGQYYSGGDYGGIGSGHYYTPAINFNAGLGYFAKPGYRPRNVIATDVGYIYGKKK